MIRSRILRTQAVLVVFSVLAIVPPASAQAEPASAAVLADRISRLAEGPRRQGGAGERRSSQSECEGQTQQADSFRHGAPPR